MKIYKENDEVICTDFLGQKIHTFVVFDTDKATGLTHINYKNLKVKENLLKLHSCTIPGAHMPLQDAFSFEILRKLKKKHSNQWNFSQLRPFDFAKAS